MASSLQQTADIITRAAGWKPALPDADGIFRFSLEGGLDFELFSPESSTGILLAVLGTSPDPNDPQSEATLQRLAALSAGCLKKRRSVFSIGERGLEVYRTFRLSTVSENILVSDVKDFLNDLAWWKRQISGSARQAGAPSSPFSFSFGNWLSADSFQG